MKHKLTLKQKVFADEYIISKNASEAAEKAGYSKKTARFIGSENLTKPNISEYIKERLEKIDSAKTMTLKEAIERCSAIARREPQKGYSRKVNKLTGEVISEIEYDFTPSVEEAQRSLEHIIRCSGGFNDKQSVSITPIIISGGDKLED